MNLLESINIAVTAMAHGTDWQCLDADFRSVQSLCGMTFNNIINRLKVVLSFLINGTTLRK